MNNNEKRTGFHDSEVASYVLEMLLNATEKIKAPRVAASTASTIDSRVLYSLTTV
jgi:hypothetical protein